MLKYDFQKNRTTKILVTGGSSMIGRAIIDNLTKISKENDINIVVFAPTHAECDLLNYVKTYTTLKDYMPNIIIHGAGYNGGISFNQNFPADIYFKTTTMALNLYRAAGEINKYTSTTNPMTISGIMASCSYPDLESGFFTETDLHKGPPNKTVECHGLAKRTIEDFGRQVWKQYQIPCQSLILTNSFGPYDSYHPDKTKVVGGMIRKFVDARFANLPEVTFWGDGSPKREFIYCMDAGRIIAQLSLYLYDCIYNKQYTMEWPIRPFNVGSGQELTIKETAEIIARVVGYNGEIKWDKTKPNGQMRKALNVSHLRNGRDFVSKDCPNGLLTGLTTFECAVAATLSWYYQGNNKEVYDNKK